jgi:RNA polymerase sigma-70 factor (ECF subfamily)
MRHFTSNEPRLRGFVLALMPHWADAEEILQRTNAVLWEKFDRFAGGSDFFAWSCEIARYEVLNFRRSQARQRMVFDQELVDRLSEEISGMNDELNERQQALIDCVQKLPEKDRRLIGARYQSAAPAALVAAQVGRSASAVYKALARIRHTLYQCVERSIGVEGLP